MREKRQHHRTVLRVPAVVLSQTGTEWRATTEDISIGGMYLSADSTPDIGLEVTVSLDLPHLGPIALPAYVRWVKAGGYGVQFGLLGPRETRAIGKLVRNSVPG